MAHHLHMVHLLDLSDWFVTDSNCDLLCSQDGLKLSCELGCLHILHDLCSLLLWISWSSWLRELILLLCVFHVPCIAIVAFCARSIYQIRTHILEFLTIYLWCCICCYSLLWNNTSTCLFLNICYCCRLYYFRILFSVGEWNSYQSKEPWVELGRLCQWSHCNIFQCVYSILRLCWTR